MNRQSYLGLMVGLGLMLGGVVRADSTKDLQAKADKAIAVAEKTIADVRAQLDEHKKMLATISTQSVEYKEMKSMVSKATAVWKETTKSLESSKKFAARISKTSSPVLAKKFALLATGSANVAQAGAKSVEMCFYFVEAVAAKNTVGIEIIRGAVLSSFDEIAKTREYYKQIKVIIAKGK